MAEITTEDYLAISRVVYRSFWLVDQGRAAESAALFTSDASLTFGEGAPKPGTLTGGEIPAMMQARQGQTQVTSRHALSNVLVDLREDGGVDVYSMLTLFRSEDPSPKADVASVADITDVMVRDGGEWKIAKRLVQPVFNG
ncbi:MAG: nuclear transport factor 2 family protein [Novosphingobium sp.]